MEVDNGPERKTIFHHKQVVFHFHVSSREGRWFLMNPCDMLGERSGFGAQMCRDWSVHTTMTVYDRDKNWGALGRSFSWRLRKSL